MPRESVPESRIRVAADRPLRSDGEFVLYWMIAARRLSWNFGLDRAIELATALDRPLVVLEALRCDYRWASDRLHRFVIDGMEDNARVAAGRAIDYFPYVEPARGAGKGLLRSLSRRACGIVTDEFPCFFLPSMVAAASRQVECRLEVVDSNGLLPLSSSEKDSPTAYLFRRGLQKKLPGHLQELPHSNPLEGLELPRLQLAAVSEGTKRWERASAELLAGDVAQVARLPIDHAVAGGGMVGGSSAGHERWREFLERQLPRYSESRNDPDEAVTSGLSPYLHFGHISVHQMLRELAEEERWSPEDVAASTTGAREGWWRMSKPAEAFLDQVVTWREVGYHFCRHRSDYAAYESLPAWALATLRKHAADEREWLYTERQLEAAETHDEIWNAAQRQLAAGGEMHNYLRMLWGKKVLEWSPTPEAAVETLIHLNNKYALDGRNPNSYSGIFWCFGRFDRPWAPERPVFGSIRYMSSRNTARKLRLKRYLERWGPGDSQLSLV